MTSPSEVSDDTVIPGRTTEASWLECEDISVPSDTLDAIQDEFGSVFHAADHAYRNGERLEQVNGVGPATVSSLSQASPLNAPGKWIATKLDNGGYKWEVGSAVLWMEPSEDLLWDQEIEHDGDESLIHEWRIHQDIPRGRIEAWWSCRKVMERNPHGPDSTVPRNVKTSGDWSLWKNHFSVDGSYIAGWENTTTDEFLDIHPGESVEAVLTYRQGYTSDNQEIDRGEWLGLLNTVEQVLTSGEIEGLDIELLQPEPQSENDETTEETEDGDQQVSLGRWSSE